MNLKGRSLQLFFIDGRPDGMLTAEVFNWTGHVLRLPRTRLKEALERREAAYTGVYILTGEDDGAPLAYIGEAEDLAARLRNHASKKDWWDSAVLVTSAANNLHKAHVKYLESRLVQIASSVAMVPLENANIPPLSSLSEADVANMESFLDTLRMVLPAIRVDMFLDKTRSPAQPALENSVAQMQVSANDGVLFRIAIARHGIEGKALLSDGEWIVQAGSKGRARWTSKTDPNRTYGKLHQELLQNGVLVSNGQNAVFQTDYAFKSPSAAAAILNGRPSNGRTDWREAITGQTYAEWEEARLTPPEAP